MSAHSRAIVSVFVQTRTDRTSAGAHAVLLVTRTWNMAASNLLQVSMEPLD